MSACAERAQALLAADVEELDGRRASDLSRHVRECVGCGTFARQVLAGREALDEALDGTVEVDARRLVSLARARVRKAPKRVTQRRLTMPAAGWLATATGVGALAIAVSLGIPRGPAPEALVPAPLAQDAPVVSAERDFAVIRTDNPNITILLVFDGQEQPKEKQYD